MERKCPLKRSIFYKMCLSNCKKKIAWKFPLHSLEKTASFIVSFVWPNDFFLYFNKSRISFAIHISYCLFLCDHVLPPSVSVDLGNGVFLQSHFISLQSIDTELLSVNKITRTLLSDFMPWTWVDSIRVPPCIWVIGVPVKYPNDLQGTHCSIMMNYLEHALCNNDKLFSMVQHPRKCKEHTLSLFLLQIQMPVCLDFNLIIHQALRF